MKTKRLIKIITTCLMALVFGYVCLFGSSYAYAEGIDNSIVLDELKKTNSFDENDNEWSTPLVKYNEITDTDIVYNYGFKMVSISFDEKRNLYIYTCQPQYKEKEFTATSINILYETTDKFDISQTSHSEIKNYDLELISRAEKFDKYYVVGFNDYTHSNEDLERYISLISIYREYDETIDNSIEVGFTNEVAFPIAEKWYVKEMNGYISYKKLFINYVKVVPTISSKILFESGFSFHKLFGFKDRCDLWYFAFNVENYVVEHIIDANLIYDIDSVIEYDVFVPTPSCTEDRIEETNLYKKKKLYISDTQQGSFIPTGWFDRPSYTWDRICMPSELFSMCEEYHSNFTDVAKEQLSSSQWVFNYLETPNKVSAHSENVMGVGMHVYDKIERYNVFNVSALRIKFIDNRGKVYNLGVVSDKFTSENNYSAIINADKDNLERLKESLEKIGAIIGIILLIVLLVFLCSIITPIWKILKFILKSIIFVLSLPFRIIKWIFKRK